MRSSQLSWQQIADNNVVFVGVQNLFFDQLRNMPISPQLVPELNGIRDNQPQNSQPAFYSDQYTTAPSEQGAAYALITHVPGPNGKNDILSFTSNRSAGYLAAVQSFTDAQFAGLAEGKAAGVEREASALLEHSAEGAVSRRRADPETFVLARELH